VFRQGDRDSYLFGMSPLRLRVREARELRGLSQAALAERFRSAVYTLPDDSSRHKRATTDFIAFLVVDLGGVTEQQP
jgi:transcriptional regulator with XRE-family HTH domain